MQYVFYDIGHQLEGAMVEIQLSVATNVRLMTAINYNLFKHGQKFNCYGGYANVSPCTIEIPGDDHWFVTIDMVGGQGTLKHSLRVLPPRMKDIESPKKKE